MLVTRVAYFGFAAVSLGVIWRIGSSINNLANAIHHNALVMVDCFYDGDPDDGETVETSEIDNVITITRKPPQ